MLDGGHVRVHARHAGKTYDPAYIEKIGLACALAGETVHRIMYYDCAPYNGTAILPVSGQRTTFTGSDAWLKTLSYRIFSRSGWECSNFVMNNNRIPYTPGQPLTDTDFHPEFEQKWRGHADRHRHGEPFIQSLCRSDRVGNKRHRLHPSHEARQAIRPPSRSRHLSWVSAGAGTPCPLGFPPKCRLAGLNPARRCTPLARSASPRPRSPGRPPSALE